MHNGPHEGGPASYPVGNGSTGFTKVSSTLTVPAMPEKIDGITYYIWSDIFFGDMSYGRMNQFVPQLILGSALDNSSGPPDYRPMWGTHSRWAFGAHYFFEVYNATTKQQDAHAAYGELFPAKVGEELFISFSAKQGPHGPEWTLKMGAVDDPARVSVVEVPAPYMGIGKHWPVPSTSWAELNYTNMCINSCWELYGATDRAHLPGSGARYNILIERGEHSTFPWVTRWDEDEGSQKPCPASTIKESHNATAQHILWDIFFPR